jgi:hypothetical protein
MRRVERRRLLERCASARGKRVTEHTGHVRFTRGAGIGGPESGAPTATDASPRAARSTTLAVTRSSATCDPETLKL